MINIKKLKYEFNNNYLKLKSSYRRKFKYSLSK